MLLQPNSSRLVSPQLCRSRSNGKSPTCYGTVGDLSGVSLACYGDVSDIRDKLTSSHGTALVEFSLYAAYQVTLRVYTAAVVAVVTGSTKLTHNNRPRPDVVIILVEYSGIGNIIALWIL